MIRGGSNQPIGANLRSALTGAAFVGAVTVYIKGDLTAQVIGSVGGGLATSNGQGYFEYIPSAAETDFAHIAFTFDGVGAVGATIQVETINAQQLSALQTASGLLSLAVSQLIQEALFEIRYARAGDSVEPDLMAFGVSKLNRLLDRWNADPRAAYTIGFTSYTPTVSHQPHTLGPSSADWAATSRPTVITGANLVLNTVTPAVRIPLTIRDADWWRENAVQGLSTTMPTDLYYQPNWPNGSVYLWPVPLATYPIELEFDNAFAMVADTDVLWLPFGYRDALTLTLAEELAPGCGQRVDPSTATSARDARALIFAANDDIPRLCTDGSGVPSQRNGSPWNYRTGLMR